jgi:hypothetical protein
MKQPVNIDNSLAYRTGSYIRLIAFLMINCFCGAQLWACSCGREETAIKEIRKQFQNASVVFEGEVVASGVGALKYPYRISTYYPYAFYTVTASKVYKGKPQQSYEIKGNLPELLCAITLEKGVKYLIYAREDSESGLLTTNICDRTRRLDSAEADIRFLRGLPPKEEDFLTTSELSERTMKKQGTISGVIYAASDECSIHIIVGKALNGSVQLEDAGNDNCKNNLYSISLPPGNYFLGAYELSPEGVKKIGFYYNARTHKDARIVSLFRGSRLFGYNFKLFTPARSTIKGKITVDGNKPLPRGKYVIKCWNGWDDDLWGQSLEITPDSNGEFKIYGLYPGQFKIYLLFWPEELDLKTRWNAEVTDVLVPDNKEFTIKMRKVAFVSRFLPLPLKK